MKRRISVLAAAGVLAVATVVPFMAKAAGATPSPGSYQAKASGNALTVVLGGNKLTGGDSSASVASTPKASASGSGEVLPVLTGSQKANATSPGTSQTQNKLCAAPPAFPVPAPFAGALSLGIACGSADAAVDSSGLPSATGSGSMVSLNIGGKQLLTQLVTAGSPLAGALTKLFGQLPSIPAGGTSLGNLLTQMGAAVATATGLLSVHVGASTSSIKTTASTLTATSANAGAKVDLLPGAGAKGGPVLSITVGKAMSKTTLDRSTAKATATADPGLVSVTFGTAATGAQTFTIAPGQSRTFMAGTPFESTISVGSGAVTQGTGKASATTHALRLDLGKGIDGGILVDLATGDAAVSGVAPPPAPPSSPTHGTTPPASVVSNTPAPPAPVSAPASGAPAPIQGPTNVHTGEPWAGSLPLAGLGVLAGLSLVYRRKLAVLAPVATHAGRAMAGPVGAFGSWAARGLRHLGGLGRRIR